jgi:hypothetical protein
VFVRQLCASDHRGHWKPGDPDGLLWTERCGLKDRTRLYRGGSLTGNRLLGGGGGIRTLDPPNDG